MSTLAARRTFHGTRVLERDAERDKQRKERHRQHSWHFLALTYMAVETMRNVEFAKALGYHRSSGDDAAGAGTGAALAFDPSLLDDADYSPQHDDGQDGGSALLTSLENAGEYLARRVEIDGQSGNGADAGSGSQGSGSFYSDSLFANFRDAGGTTTTITLPGVTPPGGQTVDFTPQIVFFEGFGDFATKLGFGENFLGIADGIDPSLQGGVLSALSFANDALAPIGLWQSLDLFDPSFSAKDGFSAQWMMQASGYSGVGFEQTQGASNVDNGGLVQWGDSDAKQIGNAAALVDSGDWDNLLWVNGDYVEFNTIVQINIIWNDDTIQLEKTDEAGDALRLVNTGDNEQLNYAEIIEYANTGEVSGSGQDADMWGADALTIVTTAAAEAGIENIVDEPDPALEDGTVVVALPAQLIVGGKKDYYAVVQQNSIIEMDDLVFEIRDQINGAQEAARAGEFADIKTGGNSQHNGSDIHGAVNASTIGITADRFALAHADTEKDVVAGDYYEFNTVFQINATNDSDTIQETGGDGWAAFGDGEGVLASGGNIQFNSATIAKADAQDQLFVGGTYSQYNLVLQINIIQTSSNIEQVSQIISDLGEQLPGLIADSIGNDGLSGGNYAKALTGSLDELVLRGQTVDMTL